MDAKSGFITKATSWCFYAIFFLTPLIMYPSTYELFEFNKMWLVFALSLIILFLWIAKIAITGKFLFQKTPLDLPLGLFLLSQCISTIISLDSHVSFWGYYSRFNGGLLSTITYIFLYYAFATLLLKPHNIEGKVEKLYSYKILFTSILSGIFVAIWGIPSHFGYDPTCLLFRGTFDTSCWTESFHPTVRMFSTLGQPNWMAAFSSIVAFLAAGFAIKNIRHTTAKKLQFADCKLFFIFAFLSITFYLCLLYTRSQSGFLGFWVGFGIFCMLLFTYYNVRAKTHALHLNHKIKGTIIIGCILFIISFFEGVPIGALEKYTFRPLTSTLFSTKTVTPEQKDQTFTPAPTQSPSAGEFGGTDSGKIRRIVWSGALEIFRRYPLFGTGVETFAYAYYKVKPLEHNLTSEWDYLYNKAHNEYINYLATTGIFGFTTYAWFIILFLYNATLYIIKHPFTTHESDTHTQKAVLVIALIGSFISLLVINFFGFSVVIVNLFIFLTPIFFYDITGILITKRLEFAFIKQPPASQTPLYMGKPKHSASTQEESMNPGQVVLLLVVGLIILFYEFLLLTYWQADQQYAFGYNLNRANEYVAANEYLTRAVQMRPDEDLFKDELSVNLATLAFLLVQQNQATQAAQFEIEAKRLSDHVITNHPNNVLYYKSRTKVLYTLAQINPKYLRETFKTIEKATDLAPTDAKILYNMALIYGQEGDRMKAIEILEKAEKLKPNYADVYYAQGLYLSQEAIELTSKDPQKAAELTEQAKRKLQFVVDNIDPNNGQVNELLKTL